MVFGIHLYNSMQPCQHHEMNSQKAFIPIMAAKLLITPAALYERQRVLVSEGVLKPVAGRGPGSGVKLTPHSVAMLLISVMVSDTMVGLSQVTKAFALLAPENRKCSLTGAKTLSDAIARVIASTTDGPTGDLILRRQARRAILMNSLDTAGTNFMDQPRTRLPILGLRTSIEMPKRVLSEISEEFLKNTKDST